MKVPPDVLEAVRGAGSLLIATHSPMDGDGFGSGLALCRAFERWGRPCRFVTEAPVPRLYRDLPGAERIETLDEDARPPAADLLVGLDAGEPDRLGRAYAERPAGMRVLNIDHHLSNPRYGDVAWVDPAAAATGELVFGLLRGLGLELDAAIAHDLLISLATDTGRFCYSSTTARTLEIAAELVRLGADPDGLQRRIYGAKPLRVLRLQARAVDRLRFFAGGALAVLTVDPDFGADLGADGEDVKDLIDLAVGIEGVVVAALVRGLPAGGTKVSLRSKDDRANVARFAAEQGGGGHIRAAGFSSEADPAATEDLILPGLEALAVAVAS